MKKNLTIKVLVADDHNLFRSGIIKLLSDHPNIYVLGEAENGPQLIQKYFDLYPDVVLADIAMPQMSGLEAVSLIKEKDEGVKALFLSMYDSDEYIYKVLKSGGMGLINKNIMEGELILAIEQVYNGEKYFRGKWNEHSLEKLFAEFEANTIQPALEKEDQELSYREEQVLRFLNQGFTSQDIAEKMNVSRKSVDYYRSSLMKRYKLKTTADLVRFAVQYFNREKKA